MAERKSFIHERIASKKEARAAEEVRAEEEPLTQEDFEAPIEELIYDDQGIPPIESRLRHNIVHMPKEIKRASGIVVYGRRIRSLLFTTDIALIMNNDADAIFCVYPFTAHRSIGTSVVRTASAPVFCGVGGGTTRGTRAVYLANDAESIGAIGVVLNSPIPNRDLRSIARVLDIPIVVTVSNEKTDIAARLRNGAAILNVAGGRNTPDIVRKIRAEFPKVPIMASGGKSAESINETIDAGANAIVYTPPSSAELFKELMAKYREI